MRALHLVNGGDPTDLDDVPWHDIVAAWTVHSPVLDRQALGPLTEG